MAPRTATLRDVATLAGVSMGTVSNVVNSPELVAPPTRQRVETAITKLGWVPNESARQLRAGRSRSIGMVVLDIANPFFTDVLAGVESAVIAEGGTVQVGNSASLPDRESAQLSLFEQQRVRGVLYAPISGVDAKAEQLQRRGIPVVLVDRASEYAHFCSVSVDDVEGGRLAVDHLITSGHERIAVVGGPSNLLQVRDRRLGAELAVGASRGAAEILVVSTPALDIASGISAAGELAALPDHERPTAVFALNDLIAIGFLQGVITHGLRVPEDIAIIGYDDILFAAAAAVPLSSIRQPREDLGRRAAALLFDEIGAHEQQRPHAHEHVRFTPELVVRRSSQLVRGPTG